MNKIAFFLFFCAFSIQAQECQKDAKSIKKGGCSVNSDLSNAVNIFSDSQKEAAGMLCFHRAKIDLSKINDKNCIYTTSNSTNIAYYRCESSETAVQDCNDIDQSPKLIYFSKSLNKTNNATDDTHEDFFKCLKKSGSHERINKDLCSFRVSNSGNTVYADCPEYKIEIFPCKDEKRKPKLSIETKGNATEVNSDSSSRNFIKPIEQNSGSVKTTPSTFIHK